MGHVACREEIEMLTKFLAGNCEENRPLGRTRRRCRMVLIWISETCCIKCVIGLAFFLI
jgi:hypothetical protein